MRLYKYILPTLAGVLSMTFAACENDTRDIFCQDAATRLSERMKECRDMLVSSEEGWIMEYTPDRNITYGTFVYGLKFTEDAVTVSCELAPGETETSYYKMTGEDGPVLSFDTYNTLIHFFSTPSSGNYQAYDGDFEFRVMDVQPDMVTFQGVRSGNIIRMRRATSDINEYVAKSAEMSDAMFPTQYDGTLGSEAISAHNSLGNRYFEFYYGENEPVGEYYIPTPQGLRFLEPVTINGATFTDLAFNTENYVFTGTADNGTTITITGSLPADYSFYNDYIGTYSVYYRDGARSISNVTVEDDGTGTGYTIKGLSTVFDIHATYDKTNGYMEINSQAVALDGSTEIWICAWGLGAGGSLTWATEAGVYVVKNPEKAGTFSITSNDYSGLRTDSFVVWLINGGSSAGQASAPWLFACNSTQLPYLTSFVKK